MSSNAVFREALDHYTRMLDENWVGKARTDAYDYLLALYAERQGEVYEVQPLTWTDPKDGTVIEFSHVFLPPNCKPGDKVRVVRVEIGMYDPKNDPPTGGAK